SLDVLEVELAQRVADDVRDAGIGELAALRNAGDVEVRELRARFRDVNDLAVGVRDRDLANAFAADVDDDGIDPLRGRARHVGIAIDEIALRLAGATRVAVLRSFGVAEDDRRQLAALRGQRDADASGVRSGDVLDAEAAVELGIRRLLLEDLRFRERRERLPQFRRVRDVAVLVCDDPVVGALLERRDGLAVGLRDGHALEIAERGFEVGYQCGAHAHRRGGALAEDDEREQHGERGGKDRNRALAHERAFLLRRMTTMPSAASVSSTGMSTMLIALSQVPSRSMSASRLRRTARSSCRIRTCSSRKRWISVCCSGLISSELPSLRDCCSSPKRCSVCVSSASSLCSVARNSRSARRRSPSTVVNGRVYVARLRRPISAALPERLSSALITKSPLLANAL